MPIDRQARGGHHRYRTEDVDVLQSLACVPGLGVGMKEVRCDQTDRARGHASAIEPRDLLSLRRADHSRDRRPIPAPGRPAREAALGDARAGGDAVAEAEILQRVMGAYHRMQI